MNSSPPFAQPALVPAPPFRKAYWVPQTTVPPSGVATIIQQSDGLDVGLFTLSKGRLAAIRSVPEAVRSSARS